MMQWIPSIQFTRAHFRSESFQRFIYFNKNSTLCPSVSIGIWGLIHLIGHIFMMQMDSFMIRVLELISVPNHSRDSFNLIKFNTLSSWREIDSVHWS